MRRAIEFLGTRLLRSRLGVALIIALAVLGVVGTARVLTGPDADPLGVVGGAASPISTVHPTAGDDGLSSLGPIPEPRTSPGAPVPAAVARAFATAWLDHRGVSAAQWHAALRPLATDTLAGKLVGVDPVEVPADRITDEPVVVPQTDNFVEVTLPVDSGRLRLGLVAPNGVWLVDVVDWEPA